MHTCIVAINAFNSNSASIDPRSMYEDIHACSNHFVCVSVCIAVLHLIYKPQVCYNEAHYGVLCGYLVFSSLASFYLHPLPSALHFHWTV